MEQTSSHSPASNRTRRKGQALAEFALTLPILLLLIFGIVEFGRAFQAWVTIQNAARAAARFASIGSVNYNIFVPDDTLPENKDDEGDLLPQDLRVQNTIVPCVEKADQRGTKGTLNGTQIYEGGKESFFGTWYDGTDCDPANEDHQQFRKDILRVVSVMNEAREASSSLLVEANRYQGLDAEGVRDLFYDVWTTPRPGNYLEPRYFDVMVCSSRIFLDSVSSSHATNFHLSRFITIRNDRDKAEIFPATMAKEDYPYPVCMLNEIPPDKLPNGDPRTDQLANPGVRWLDAGGPGERVTISVAFNHPLVTPIFNQQFIFMEARRSIVNESFRAPRAVGAFQRSLPPGGSEIPEQPPTETPTATNTATNTNTATATFTNTLTPTPEPFDCDKVTAEWSPSPFVSDTFFMIIKNGNVEDSHVIELTRTRLEWNALDDFRAMYLQTMSLDDLTYWAGPNGPVPAAQQPQVVIDTREHPTFYPEYRKIAPNSSSRWKGYFRNGPTNLAAYFQLWDFDAVFEFDSPNGICSIVLQRPQRPEPTITLTPTDGPPPTNTPNCATLQQLSLSFGDFLTRGVVYFELTNSSTRPTSLTGFSLVWPDATHPHIGMAAGAYRLALVTVGGDGPADPASVPVWQAASDTQDSVGNKKTTTPYDFGTVHTNTAEGQWLGNAIINPGTTRIYLDFDGPGLIGRLYDNPYKHRSWHYHQPVFRIGCTGSGSGGQGPGQNGDIGLPLPSPAPTSPPAPTPTPGPTKPPTPKPPTSTAGPTRTPPPPTKTHTPAPPTVRPSNTPFGQPTQKPGSGGE